MGYKSYWCPGKPTVGRWGHDRERGGLLTLVRSSLRQRFQDASSSENTQTLAVWVQGVCCINCYSPPDSDDEAAQEIQELWVKNQLHRTKSWVFAGDFNQNPPGHDDGTGTTGNLLLSLGGRTVSDFRATRWEGQDCIDWFVTNDCRNLRWHKQIQVQVSDHVPICCELMLGNQDCKQGRLRPSPKWTRPPNCCPAVWRRCLEQTWDRLAASNGPVATLQTKLIGQRHSIQEEWNEFMNCLNACFEGALRKILSETADPELIAQCNCLLAQPGVRAQHKGQVAQHQWTPPVVHTAGHKGDCQGLKKNNRRLARLYELQRLASKDFDNDKPWLGPQACNLARKLWGQLADGRPWKVLAVVRQEIAGLKELRLFRQEKAKQEALKTWREGLKDPTLATLGRWMKGKSQDPAAAHLFDDTGTAETPVQAADMIVRHWNTVWHDPSAPSPQEVGHRLLQDWGPVSPVQWRRPTADDLLWGVRHCKGSAGPDNWSAAEVAFLPTKAVQLWFDITQIWLAVGALPQQLREARLTNLNKPNKQLHDFRLAAKDTRPICVLSLFWRIYASCWHRTTFSQWAVSTLPSEVSAQRMAGGPDLLASELQDVLAQEGGFIATLDWKQCYDRMSSQATKTLLQGIGWPSDFCELLDQAWCHRRWVSWETHTRQEPLLAKVAPQGCPLAPLVLQVWTTCGFRFTEARAAGTGPSLTRIFMDDRTTWAKQWSGIQSRIDAWDVWSSRTGLRESREKTQVAAKGKQNLLILRLNADPLWVKSDIKFLGQNSVTTGRRRQSPLEEGRLQEAARRASLLKCTGLSWSQLHRAFQSFVCSVGAYGWVARLPLLKSTNKLFNAFTHCVQDQQRVANCELCKVLYGASLHLDVRTACTLLKRVAIRKVRQDAAAVPVPQFARLTWQNKAATSLGLLRRWLAGQGWTEAEPWFWHHPFTYCAPCECVLDLRRPGLLPAALHAVRAQWRAGHFATWVMGPRHEVRDLTSRFSRHELLSEYGRTDLRLTRSLVDLSGAHRTVLLGAVVSSMWLFRSGATSSGACPLCGAGTGSFDHLFYECSAHSPPLVRPSSGLLARLRWPRDKSQVAHVHGMAAKVQQLWRARFPTAFRA